MLTCLFLKQTIALAVWQPEDVHLVRDILKLEHEPLNEVLKVDSLKPETTTLDDETSKTDKEPAHHSAVNTNFTKSGRPINNNEHVRWKPFTNSSKLELVDDEKADNSEKNKTEPTAAALSEVVDVVNRKPQKLSHFKLAGSSLNGGAKHLGNFMEEGRPVPTEIEFEDPVSDFLFVKASRAKIVVGRFINQKTKILSFFLNLQYLCSKIHLPY